MPYCRPDEPFSVSTPAKEFHRNERYYSGRGSEQAKQYNKGGISGTYNLPGQLDVFYNNPALDPADVDYVTMSIGGNDVGFSDIIQTAGLPGNYKAVEDKINKELRDFYNPGGTYEKLRDTYLRVAKAAPNATIIIAGYPPLIAAGGGNSTLFDEEEASAIDVGVSRFNRNIQRLVEDLQASGVKIEFVDVQKAFRGHEAYSEDPWINEVQVAPDEEELSSFTLGSMNSIHPNYKGAQAYARCVQQRIDELEYAKKLKRDGLVSSGKRNIVLVLDNSGSMEGEPIQETKSAAKNFVDTIFEEDAAVGVVSFSSDASVRSPFSRDAEALKSAVDSIYPDGWTNTSAGLSAAAGMLRACDKGQKIIILMSDGLTNEGLMGEELDAYIESLKDEGIDIYTMGFFQGLYGSDLFEGQGFMEETASPGYHYEIDNASNLVDFFGDVADQINGQKYSYARIECPVDVEVTVGDETLSSVENITRTRFGTLTFEAGEEGGSGTDNRTKILRLREDGTNYRIQIHGNGVGTMDYTAGFMDEDGVYSDLREISDIPITRDTYIEANADRGSATTLRVDENGDGNFDKTFTAGESSFNWSIFIIIGAVLVAAAIVLLILFRKKRAGSREPAAPGRSIVRQSAPPNAAPTSRPAPPKTAPPIMPAAAQTRADDLVCGKCGSKNSAGSGFCCICGTPLRPKPAADSGTAAAFRYCRKCGAKNDGNAGFCTNCGAQLSANGPANIRYCTKCGAQNDGNAQFCVSCGNRF